MSEFIDPIETLAASHTFYRLHKKHQSAGLPLVELCTAIDAGLTADNTIGDPRMAPMVEELTNNAAELRRGLQALALLPELAALLGAIDDQGLIARGSSLAERMEAVQGAISEARDAGLI